MEDGAKKSNTLGFGVGSVWMHPQAKRVELTMQWFTAGTRYRHSGGERCGQGQGLWRFFWRR
jgi:hypothetical protein